MSAWPYAVDWDLTVKAIGAVGIPITLGITWWAHRQRTTFEMVDRLYSLCHILQGHMLHEWRLSHLFCISDVAYSNTVERIAAATQSAEERSKLIVEEQQLAIHMFVIYEQVFYHHKYCGFFNRSRREFLDEMLDYFASRLLRNPRLLAYLAADTSGRSLHLERLSAKYLVERLEGDFDAADLDGPFKFNPRHAYVASS
jgi:hypothetical protein